MDSPLIVSDPQSAWQNIQLQKMEIFCHFVKEKYAVNKTSVGTLKD